MKIVMQTIFEHTTLVTQKGRGENVKRRAITYAPRQGGRIEIETGR
jgi:hypothetical protein